MAESYAAAHIALFMSLLTGGGVQRTMLRLAGALAEGGHRVDLLVCHPNAREPEKVIPAGVRLIRLRRVPSLWGRLMASKADPAGFGVLLRPVLLPLQTSAKLRYLPDLARYLRRERPQALLSAMTYSNLIAIWARQVAGVSTRIVVSERNMLSSYVDYYSRQWRWRYLPSLVGRTYAFADARVAVSQAVADDLAATAGISPQHIITIANPVVTPELLQQAHAKAHHPWFAPGMPAVVLGVGRLVAHKDFSTLLRAFARVRRARPLRLMLLGEGPERAALQRQAGELGVTDDVAFPGWVDNPLAYMAGAGVLVLASHWEGLPGVLIEALASGCPIVATDAPGGAAEILDGGVYGRLVPVGDARTMAEAIASTLDAPRESPRLLRRANEFSVERALNRYRSVLLDTAPP